MESKKYNKVVNIIRNKQTPNIENKLVVTSGESMLKTGDDAEGECSFAAVNRSRAAG